MSKLTKTQWGKLYERIDKHLEDIIESYFIDPSEIGNPTKVFVTRKEFVKMLIARLDRDEELSEL